MALSPEEQQFYDEQTGRCRCFKERNNANGAQIVINVEESFMYEYHKRNKCYKGNNYAPYCAFCPKELCLYYDPEVNLVPEGQGAVVILTPEEVEKRTQLNNNQF